MHSPVLWLLNAAKMIRTARVVVYAEGQIGGYLAALSVECALKAMIVSKRQPVDWKHPKLPKYLSEHDLENLSREAGTFPGATQRKQ